MNEENNQGFSLIEMLVVLVVFSILIILSTQAVFLTLRNAKKAENLVKVRQNLDNAVGVMERGLRSASYIDCYSQTDDKSIAFDDVDGNGVTYSCTLGGTITEEVLGPNARSGNLTSDEVSMAACTFDCYPPNPSNGVPPKVTIDLEAQSVGSSGTEAATVSTRTQVYVRIYDYQ